MHLQSWSADHFRNLKRFELRAHRRLNVFLGENGQGKTNLLEAVHLATALRPLRAVERGRDLIQFGAERATVKARFDLEGPLDVDVEILPTGRRARIAGKVVRDVGEIAARIRVVAFTPDDLAMIRGGPGERRRALDRFAFSLSSSFGAVARRYESALLRRNRLLRTRSADRAQIAAYTTPLVDAGVALCRARHRAAAIWSPKFADATLAISDGALECTLAYRTSLGDDLDAVDDAALAARFSERLHDARDHEARRQQTLVGPHLDDLVVTLRERRARHFASQGEARALVLALKIAAVRALTEAHDTAPVLVLDDVAGELDPARARLLFALIDEVGTQAFVTATHRGLLASPGAGTAFALQGGRVVGEEPL